MKYLFFLSLAVLMSGCSATEPAPQALSKTELTAQLDALSKRAVAYLADVAIDSTQIPRSLEADGSFHGTVSRQWTSGFYPGTLWQLYRYSGEEDLKEAASRWTAFQTKEQFDTHTHDLGFKIYCSFGEGLAVMENPHYEAVILQASETLSKRFKEQVGAIRSWDFNREVWQYPVIIDNMMNLEMLFAAAQLAQDSTFYHIAYQHALTTMEHHFRPDNSSYHVIDFDTISGSVRNRHTHQGASHESAWARGQAWGLYGFTMSFRETGDQRFLEQARAIADFFFTHPNLPADGVPYWDFNAPNIPNEPRDASAAAVAASALLELYELDPENKDNYLEWADRTLRSLGSATYTSDAPPFLLQHSVGSIPGDMEVDVPLIYADYYYVEALLRRLDLEENLRRT